MKLAFVPSAPLLLLGYGPPDLRTAIETAVATLTGDLVVVGAAPAPGWWEGSVDLTPCGVPGVPKPDPLPLSLAVGRTLLGGRPHRLWGVPSGPLPEAESYLVVADGTAKRTAKAPGAFDPRAEAFDDEVAQRLRDGVIELDEELGRELWAGGLAAWAAVAPLGPARDASLLYSHAPYGVGYVVATWTLD